MSRKPRIVAEFDGIARGIPCKIQVTRYVVVPPDPSCRDSDMDFYGYTEVEYNICDRRGRLAPWIEDKMSEKDHENVEQQIHDWFS